MLADYRQDEQIKYYSDYKNSHAEGHIASVFLLQLH